MRRWSAPSTPTRPRRSPNNIANLLGAQRKFNQLHARIAVSNAAAWTGKRWFGGEYEIIPNGVDLSGPAYRRREAAGDELQRPVRRPPEARKGLPVLLSAFEALVEHVPVTLTAIGVDEQDVMRYVGDPGVARQIDARGHVDDDELWRASGTPTCSSPPRYRERASG